MIFINMKPTQLLDFNKYQDYLNFIHECRQKNYSDELVLHNHHIIPRFIDTDNEHTNKLVRLSVEDHITAHLLMSKCFDENSHEQIGNLRAVQLLSKKSLKYVNELRVVYDSQRGENNPAKRPDVKKRITEGLKQYYSKNSEVKKGKTYEEIYGKERAEEEKLKRKKNTRSKESYQLGAAKAGKKLKGKFTGSKNPFAKRIEVNGVEYGSVVECTRALGVSAYKLKKHYNIKEL